MASQSVEPFAAQSRLSPRSPRGLLAAILLAVTVSVPAAALAEVLAISAQVACTRGTNLELFGEAMFGVPVAVVAIGSVSAVLTAVAGWRLTWLGLVTAVAMPVLLAILVLRAGPEVVRSDATWNRAICPHATPSSWPWWAPR